jgi:TonB family protein
MAWWMNRPAGQRPGVDETVLLPPEMPTDVETGPVEIAEQPIGTAAMDQADQSNRVEKESQTSESEHQLQSTAAEPGDPASTEEQELQAPEVEQQLQTAEAEHQAQSTAAESEDPETAEEQALQPPTVEAEATGEPVVEGISIASRPAGSVIYIDGAYAGTSPLEMTDLQAGQTVLLRVEAEGYRAVEQAVRVPSGEMLELDLDLEKLPERFALTVDPDPPNARVRILNIEPRYQSGMLLEPGQYHIEVSLDGYITHRQWVEVRDRIVSMAVNLQLETATAEQGFDLRSSGQYDSRDSSSLLRRRGGQEGSQPGGAGPGIDNPELVPTVTVRPVYPRDAAMAGIEGWVQVEFTLTELGMVKDPIVINSQPPDTFDQEALRTILKWRYRPIVENGTPVSKRVIQTIDFSLDDWQ